MIINHTILIFAFVLIIVLTSNYLFKRQFNKYVTENHREVSQKIVNDTLNLFKNENPPKYEDLYKIGSQALDKGIVYMVNIDYENQLICMSTILPGDSVDMLTQMEKTMHSVYPHFEGQYQEDKYILEENGVTYGYVTIGYYGPIYYSEFDAAFIKAFNRTIIILGVLFFGFTTIFIYFIADKITKPITFISKKAKEIEQGNYSEIIDIKPNTIEINDLLKSVNSLSKNLNNQQEIKKQMAQNYTHEIRTPLTSIMTTIEGMKDGYFEITSERLDTIYAEISRIINLVENVDMLVETSDGQNMLNTSQFSLKDNINNILSSFESQFVSKNISARFNYCEKEAYKIVADEEKINSVIYNLISNSCKYTDEHGKIDVIIDSDKVNYTIRVIDTGIGISEKDKELIFEHLYRADKSRVREVSGKGIGLAICKNIILAHGGTIKVNSELNSGSEFIVKLPREGKLI